MIKAKRIFSEMMNKCLLTIELKESILLAIDKKACLGMKEDYRFYCF